MTDQQSCCNHRLAGGPLQCVRTDPHQPGRGCIYHSATGSDVDDHHPEGGHG